MPGPASEPRAGEPPPFEIVRPRSQSVPLVFNSPHSGHFYPSSFLALSRLDRRAIRRSEDVLVDVLFSGVTELGAPLMRALYPRAYLDVNREPYELDPKMFTGQLPAFANVRSVRVAGGLGTIPRLVSDTEDIYGAPLAVEEALERINRVYRPYHDALRRLLAETHVDFGSAILRSEDVLVDVLFSGVTELGAPLMRALYPRAYLDVNREPYELDPKMFTGQLPAFANVRSVRVAGGLGTIPRLVSDTEDIYGAPLAVEEALERINRVYRPYHDALRRLLAETHVDFGSAILIDCHSMPSSLRGLSGRNRPDFVLGDRFGASCVPQVMEAAVAALRDLGYNVCRNKPYAGGFITEHYGRPGRGLHALQVEINRALYMDEERLEPHAGFSRLQRDLMRFAESMARIGGGAGEPLREAAE